MSKVDEVKNLAQSMVASYERRVLAIERIIEETYKMSEDSRKMREEIGPTLRENLAKSKSLRRRDFDNLMSGIYSQQSQREEEVKKTLMNFLREQKRVASELKDALAKNELGRVKKAESQIKERIGEVKKLLGNFRREQSEIGNNLRHFLQRNKSLRIKDFKEMVGRIQSRQEERGKEVRKLMIDAATQKRDRRGEIERMLADFHRESEDLASSWQSVITMLERKKENLYFGKEE